MAQSGQLRGKVTEGQLIELLEQVSFHKFHLSMGILTLCGDGRSPGKINCEEIPNCGVSMLLLPRLGR